MVFYHFMTRTGVFSSLTKQLVKLMWRDTDNHQDQDRSSPFSWGYPDIDVVNSTLTWMISCVFPQTGGASWCIPGEPSGKPCWIPSHTSGRRRERSPARGRPARIWSIQEVELRLPLPSTRSSVSKKLNSENLARRGNIGSLQTLPPQ